MEGNYYVSSTIVRRHYTSPSLFKQDIAFLQIVAAYVGSQLTWTLTLSF